MATTGIPQADLFGEAGTADGVCSDIEALPLLAIPCGFRDRRNAPCRRLGTRPVTIDGEPFDHRGCRIVHCDPACFRGQAAESGDRKPPGDRRAGGEAGPIG